MTCVVRALSEAGFAQSVAPDAAATTWHSLGLGVLWGWVDSDEHGNAVTRCKC